MKPAKWEKIKTSAAAQAMANAQKWDFLIPGEAMIDAMEKRQNIYKSVDAFRDAIQKRILAWDVRCCGGLRKIFPKAFPPAMRRGALCADLDEQGDWIVFSGSPVSGSI